MSDLESGADLVRRLSGWLAGTDITLLELRTADETVRLARNRDAVVSPDPMATRTPPADPYAVVVSPGAGVFRRAHPARSGDLAKPGQTATAGDVLGLLQVGSLLIHVVAPADGVVIEALASDGALVGYGTALLRMERSVAA